MSVRPCATSVLGELDLSHNRLDGEALGGVAAALSCFLVKLRLAGCGMGPASAQLLASALPGTCLKELYLNNNALGVEGLAVMTVVSFL